MNFTMLSQTVRWFLVLFWVVFFSTDLVVAGSADLNGDGRIDYHDFAIMASQWLTPQAIPTNPRDIIFVDIPAGTFEMGDHYDVGLWDEKPLHMVTLDAFRISRYETTNAQYATYLNEAMAAGLIQIRDGIVYSIPFNREREWYIYISVSSYTNKIEYLNGQFTVHSQDGHSMANYPVVSVGWYGAKAFCDYYGYRLPTEAEWEYTARGGHLGPYYKYPWGNNEIDCDRANFRERYSSNEYNVYDYCNPLNLKSSPYSSPIGYFGPQGAYGLCDVIGNVSEWCQDRYDPHYYQYSPSNNPISMEGFVDTFTTRGGSWSLYVDYCRIASRGGEFLGSRHFYSDVGFRVCSSIVDSTE